MVRINHNLTPEALAAPVTLYNVNSDPTWTQLHLKFATTADFLHYLETESTGDWWIFPDDSGRLVAEKLIKGAGIYTVFRELRRPCPDPRPSYPGPAFS